MPLEDAGPEGADKGNGGKYLILPPGYMARSLPVTFPCNRTPTAVSRYCVPISSATPMPTS